MIADIIVDLQYGDSGKGKVTHHLLKHGEYTHCIRYNGGCNAGHTIFHYGKKFVTHHIPAGVFFGVKSIIGPGCVLNINQFFKEIIQLESAGIDCNGLIKIARNVHIITDEHMFEDKADKQIGTTKRGNGPAYRDKYYRNGVLAKDIFELHEYIIDMYEELHENKEDVVALFEGAQGFGLDIDWGDYPYVTSSHCTTAGAMLNGVPPKSIRKVWGVAKCYETYVGAKKFQPAGMVFDQLREAGGEYGATTGRPRQCNWTSLEFLSKAININGVTDLVMNKFDVLRKMDTWILRDPYIQFQNENEMKEYITDKIKTKNDIEFYFSESPERI